MQNGQLHNPVSLSLIYERTSMAQGSYLTIFFGAFLLCYILDEALGQAFGLSQYTICGLAAGSGLVVIGVMIFHDTFIRKWQLFYLEPNECLFAYRDQQPVLIMNTEEIRKGALQGCSNMTIISLRPWIDRKIDILIGGAAFHFSASLRLNPVSAHNVRQWLNFEEEDVINEIRSWANTVARRIGVGAAIESPDGFTSMIESEFNSKLLGEIGLNLSLSWTEQKSRSEINVHQ